MGTTNTSVGTRHTVRRLDFDSKRIQEGEAAAARVRAREAKERASRPNTRAADDEAIRLGREAEARIAAREAAARGARPARPQRVDVHRDSQQFESNMRAVAATTLLLSSPAAPWLLLQSWSVNSHPR